MLAQVNNLFKINIKVIRKIPQRSSDVFKVNFDNVQADSVNF